MYWLIKCKVMDTASGVDGSEAQRCQQDHGAGWSLSCAPNVMGFGGDLWGAMRSQGAAS